jgi:hypothetical protein
MMAQQEKTKTKDAERLDGDNGCKEISDCPLFNNDDTAKEIVHIRPLFSATEIGVSGESTFQA